MTVVSLWGDKSASEFTVINPSIWEGRTPPRREWMVERVALRGTVCMLSGDGGKGKSLLMQQLCSCAALGKDWLDLRVSGGRSLLLSCEDDADELWRRQEDINRHLGCTMTDVCEGGLILKDLVGQGSDLVGFDRKNWRIEPTALFDCLWDFSLRECVQYIVIDTATATFGANQNDEKQVSHFVALLRRLAIQVQGCVIITKHPSMMGRANGSGESGSVTWNNSVRSRIYLRENKAGGLELKTMKANYGAAGEAIPLRWERGVFVVDEIKPEYRDYYNVDD